MKRNPGCKGLKSQIHGVTHPGMHRLEIPNRRASEIARAFSVSRNTRRWQWNLQICDLVAGEVHVH